MNNTGEERVFPSRYLVISIILLPLLLGIADHGMWTPDEPRETQMAWEMLNGGSWIVPQLAGVPFVEKPPLYYWSLAGMMAISRDFLEPVHSARIASAIFSFLNLLLLVWLASGFLEWHRAWQVGMIFSTMAGFLELSHWIRIDSLLCMLITGSIACFLRPVPSRFQGICLVTGYLFMGLAFLTKGPIGPVMIGLVWMTMVIVDRRWLTGDLPAHLTGFLACIVLCAVWMIPFQRSVPPDLFREWFWDNQFGRFLGSSRHLGHIHGPTYYLGLVWGILFPWSLILFALVSGPIRRQIHRSYPRILWWGALAWSSGGFAFLSISGTKRSIYLFPLLPGFAILIFFLLEQRSRWLERVVQCFSYLMAILALLFALTTPVLQEGRFQGLDISIHPMGTAAALGAVICLFRLRQTIIERLACVTALAYGAMIITLVPVFDGIKNYAPAIVRFHESVDPSLKPQICGWNLDQTTRALFAHYTDWNIPLTADPDVLSAVLDGTHPEYTHVIVQMGKKFPPPETSLPPWRMVITERTQTGRELALIVEEIE